MINNLAYTSTSLAPNAVSAKNQRTGLTVDHKVAEKFADHAVEGTANILEYIVEGQSPTIFEKDLRMANGVVESVLNLLDGLSKLPDSIQLVPNPKFKKLPEGFGFEESKSRNPFQFLDSSNQPLDTFEFNGNPIFINLEHEPPSIFAETYPMLDGFLKKNQSDKPTQTIPAFNPKLIREKTMNALEGRGLIRKRELS
jgi:hypothetical protein